MRIIEKYNVTILYNAAYQFIASIKNNLIHSTDLSSVKRIYFFGTKIPASFLAETVRYFPNAKLESWYGMAEIGIATVATMKVQDENGGKLVDGYMAKIIDSNENRCGPNTRGEIRIKRKYKFLGYFNDPEATGAAVDEEGFYRTGDLGHFDENGLLFVDDRQKNVIRVFYFIEVLIPAEIESYLTTLPDIPEVCVVGIPHSFGSALPAAVIVREPNSNLSQRDVFDAVAGERTIIH